MSRFSAVVVLLAGGIFAACGQGSPPERVVGLSQPLIGGTPDPNETGVVHVSHLDYPFLCSGTLIAPTLVVTAKHCTFREKSGADEPMKGDRFRVGFGPKTGQLTYRGTTKMEWIGMPGNVEVQPSVDGGEDIALLWLSSAAPAGSIIHPVKLDYVPKGGDQLTIVGYGQSGSGSGTKLMTVDAFNGVNGSTGILQAKGKGACSGDSGGAFFLGAFPPGVQREWVGVTSTAGASSPTTKCDIGITNATSVRNPNVSKFLADALGLIGVCSPAAEICGDGKDQDCDGIADNQCKKDGATCNSEVECESGLCEDPGTGTKVCVRVCDDQTPCPAGSRCVTSCSSGFCNPGVQGSKKLLDACTDSAECATNHCGGAGCTLVCNPLLGQCPDDMACAAGSGCGDCEPLAAVPGPRALGERCAQVSDCQADATCSDDGFGVLRCATPCLEGSACPSGFLCKQGVCTRGGGFALGERCMAANDCGSLLCAAFNYPELNFCTKLCTGPASCSEGFECKDELGAKICVPLDFRMGEACIADSQCLSGRCHPVLSVCTRACDPQTAPCPPGFACHVVDGELSCEPAGTRSPGPDAGSGGSGGGMGGSGASAGSGGSGAMGTGASGGAGAKGTEGDADSGGCACRASGGSTSPQSQSWFVAVAIASIAMLRRRARRASN